MGDFVKCMDVVFAAEGGYSNNPADRGGCTNFGITEGFLMSIKYPTTNPADLNKEDAGKIYEQHFWQPIMGNSLPGPVALIVFDMAVNSGVKTAIRRLQYVLNGYKIIDMTGVMDAKTLSATQSAFNLYADIFLGELLQSRREYYGDIIRKNPSQGVFAKGWNNRINSLLTALMVGRWNDNELL